jgi:hypothetical protein
MTADDLDLPMSYERRLSFCDVCAKLARLSYSFSSLRTRRFLAGFPRVTQ